LAYGKFIIITLLNDIVCNKFLKAVIQREREREREKERENSHISYRIVINNKEKFVLNGIQR